MYYGKPPRNAPMGVEKAIYFGWAPYFWGEQILPVNTDVTDKIISVYVCNLVYLIVCGGGGDALFMIVLNNFGWNLHIQ